jgi:hypothetical protein
MAAASLHAAAVLCMDGCALLGITSALNGSCRCAKWTTVSCLAAGLLLVPLGTVFRMQTFCQHLTRQQQAAAHDVLCQR